jgi:hypothetical protein
MPSVFTDEAGTYDLTITTAADWTVSSGGLPNGDNYVTGDGSIAATYNVNGDDFDFADGTAWSVEFWLYYATATDATQAVVVNMANASGAATEINWRVIFSVSETVVFTLNNTGGSSYLEVASSGLTASTWYHVVGVKETGDVLRLYVDNVEVATDSTTSGTANTTGASDRVYFGTYGNGDIPMGASSSGLRISKLAIYNKELSLSEINDHYLSMVAT